ncbi:unnamed protein product, partial [Ectocarpus sp. 12 AP-2014]
MVLQFLAFEVFEGVSMFSSMSSSSRMADSQQTVGSSVYVRPRSTLMERCSWWPFPYLFRRNTCQQNSTSHRSPCPSELRAKCLFFCAPRGLALMACWWQQPLCMARSCFDLIQHPPYHT